MPGFFFLFLFFVTAEKITPLGLRAKYFMEWFISPNPTSSCFHDDLSIETIRCHTVVQEAWSN